MQIHVPLWRRLIPALALLLTLGILGVAPRTETRAASAPPAPSTLPTKPGKPIPPHPLPPAAASQDLPAGKAAPPVAPLRARGPDAYGYLVSDSTEPNGPQFNYLPGTSLVLTGDDSSEIVSLPFRVTIYDRTTSYLTVNTNGLVYLGDCTGSAGCYYNYPLPNVYAPAATIAPLWDDLVLTDTTTSAGVYTAVYGSTGSRSFVIEWENAAFYDDPNSLATFEIVFHENSNEIDFQYGNLTGSFGVGGHAVVGIQNYAQTIGLMYSYNEPVLSNSLAVRYLFLTSPGDQSVIAPPCATVTYRGFVSNPYSDFVTYQLQVNDRDPSFGSVITPTSISLAPGASQSYIVGQIVAPGTSITATNVTTLSVVSTNPGFPLSEQTHLNTQVQAASADFVPDNANGAGHAGDTLTYTLSLYNRIGPSAAFQLTASGNNWPTTITPAQTGTIAAGAGISITVRVTIPSNSQLGESDTLFVTASAQLSTTCAFSGTATIDTFNNNQVGRHLLPQARARHALVDFPLDGRVYLLGGVTVDGSRDLPIEEYDARADTWTGRNNLAHPVSNVGAATLGDTIYVVGGFDGSDVVNLVQTYQPISDAAGILASDPLPAPRQGAGVVALNGKMYVIGGADAVTTTRTVYEFDPARPPGSRWVRDADMPTRRAFLAAATLNGRIYAIGGMGDINNPNDLATVEIFDPASNSWSTGPALRTPRSGLAAAGLDTGQPCGGYIYVFGGGWSNPVATVERFDPGTGTWSYIAPLSSARRTLAATYVSNGHLLLVAGGFNQIEVPNVDAVGCGGALPTATATPFGGAPTFTPRPVTQTPTASPTPFCSTTFSDVQPADYFYVPVSYLACHGVISGYADGTFRPYANMTRAQLSKVIVLSQGWALQTPAAPHFSDVPADNPFYAVVETAYSHGIISGYGDGTFHPYADVTRGQIAKIVVLAEGWPLLNPSTATFTDVPVGSAFFQFVETAYNRGILSGYSDQTFRPNNSATRGQVSKIVYLGLGSP